MTGLTKYMRFKCNLANEHWSCNRQKQDNVIIKDCYDGSPRVINQNILINANGLSAPSLGYTEPGQSQRGEHSQTTDTLQKTGRKISAYHYQSQK